MNYDELQLEYIGGDSMDKIAIVKKEVQLQNHYQQLKNLKKVPKIKHKIYAIS